MCSYIYQGYKIQAELLIGSFNRFERLPTSIQQQVPCQSKIKPIATDFTQKIEESCVFRMCALRKAITFLNFFFVEKEDQASPEDASQVGGFCSSFFHPLLLGIQLFFKTTARGIYGRVLLVMTMVLGRQERKKEQVPVPLSFKKQENVLFEVHPPTTMQFSHGHIFSFTRDAEKYTLFFYIFNLFGSIFFTVIVLSNVE